MKTVIKIDHLNIRLKGISSQAAQLAINGLGSELLRQLARDRVFSRQAQENTVKINTIDAGTYTYASKAGASPNPLDLKGQIATGVSVAIGSRMAHLHGKGVK